MLQLVKPNQKNIISTAVTATGVVAGGMSSKGINAFLPEAKTAKIASKAGIALVAILAASSVKGASEVSNFAKGSLYGVAGEKIISAVTDAMKGGDLDNSTKTDNLTEFAKRATGLKGTCGCQSYEPQMMDLNYTALNMPHDSYEPQYTPSIFTDVQPEVIEIESSNPLSK